MKTGPKPSTGVAGRSVAGQGRVARSVLVLVACLALLVPLGVLAGPGGSGKGRGAKKGARPVKADVRVILARTTAAAPDKRLKDVADVLRNGLGSRFKSFELLASKSMRLLPQQSDRLTVPGDGSVALTYNGLRDKYLRFRAIFQDLTVRVKVYDGGTFIQAGRKHKDGVLVYLVGAKLQ